MVLLSPEEQNQLKLWLNNQPEILKIEKKQTLVNYILTLLKRDAPKSKMIELLNEFIGETTSSFVDNIHSRIETKDFSFTPIESKPEPPKPSPPPVEKIPEKVQAKTSEKPQTKQSEKVSNAISEKVSEKPKPKPKQTEQQNSKQQSKSETASTEKPKPDSKPQKTDSKPQQKQQDTKKPKKEDDFNKNKQDQKHSRFNKQKRDDKPSKQPPLSHSKRLFSDASDPDDDYVEPVVEEFSEEKIESKAIEPSKRYIVFAAGIDRNKGSLSYMFKLFTKFGRVLAIEVNVEEKVAYVEYTDLLSCFKAIKANAKKSIFGNNFIRIDYAIKPDEEELEALETEYKKRKEERKSQKFDSQAQPTTSAGNSGEINEESQTEKAEVLEMKAELEGNIKAKMQELTACHDEAKKEQINQEISELKTLLEECALLMG
ncbi:hypothetical protein TRFO_23052 [Tritrichomonas foetus]|uniref:RRM domain-containing protein n=1 Tax=Tritrichomonas foetus TaxID=1144522 RepID=A0A1J4KBV6_9EUKA|nr:hypothetical protein TRFO_23052 [Tritrichomonas foetus]|eukprot:OHT08450.1 hypothetical protein TRFO_23052 [Tritrichomonas foetus]